MLIELDGSVARSRYQITADLHQRPSDEALLAAPIGSTSDPETYLRLPELDGDSGDRLDEIRLFATTTAADTPGGPGAQLLGLERRLGASGGFGYEPETRPGHSVGSLALLLRSKSGYTEQYASLFAIAARQLRIPTRVVVGFRTDTRTSDGTYVILSTHVYVWAESFFDGLGWVSFDPTPVGDNPLPPPDLQPEDPDGDGDNPGASTEVVRGPSTTLLGAPRSVVVGLLVLIGVAAVAILAMVATIIGMKMLRRRRRRNASSDVVRVVAAWQEAQDRVRDWGVPVLLSHTDRQIVTTSIEALGEERAGRLGSLASLATSAKFAGERPPRSAGNSAWNEADALRLDLRSGRSIIARVRATLNPRSLVGPQR
jgi:type II secretory pathway pseudopilin PulG